MKKNYKDIISDLNRTGYDGVNGIIIVMKLILEIDAPTLVNKQSVEDVFVSLKEFFEKNNINYEFDFNNISCLPFYLSEQELKELIKILKRGAIVKINLLILNYLLKYLNLIYCEFTEEQFFYGLGYSDMLFLEDEDNLVPRIDFNDPKINILEYAYMMLNLYLENIISVNPEESPYLCLLKDDNVDDYILYCSKYNININNYKNGESTIYVLDILRSGSHNLNNYLEQIGIDIFKYDINPVLVFKHILISNNFELIERYYKLRPDLLQLKYLLNTLLNLNQDTFEKVYNMYPFNDVDFIKYFPGRDTVLDKNMKFLIDQNNFDINRITDRFNVMMIILEIGSIDLIEYALSYGGDLFIQVNTLSSKNNLLYKRSVYGHVILNKDQKCREYVLNKIPSEVMYKDLTPTVFLLQNGEIETLTMFHDKELQNPELIRRNPFLLDYNIRDNNFVGFKYLVDTLGPNARCYNQSPIIHAVIEQKNDEMFDYLLGFNNLSYNVKFNGRTPAQFAIKNNYIYGVKRLIELGVIYQDMSFSSPRLTLWVSKKKQPEIRKMLSKLIPKKYYIKSFFEFIIVLVGLVVGIVVLYYLIKWRYFQ